MKASNTATSRMLFLGLMAALIAVTAFSTVLTSGTPVVPHNFYGTLTIDGSPAPNGTEMKGYVGAEDRTYTPPYHTIISGQYGSDTFEGKFGVLCDMGEQITFAIEDSPGAGTFHNVFGPECLPGAETNLDLSINTGAVCTDNDADGYGNPASASCAHPELDCNDSDSSIHPGAAEVCDGKDNDCDGEIDEDLTQACGSGDCSGTQTCSAGSWSSCSTSGADCGICASCSSSGACSYDSSQDSDCDSNDIAGIATCMNVPDSNPFTWDSRLAFDSQCTGMDVCSAGDSVISHACSKSSCAAPCETNSDCNDGNSSTIDACLSDCTCQHTYLPSCGNSIIDAGEQCELPGTANNNYCSQSTNECQGTKLGARDAFGDCSAACGCGYDEFSYSCMQGQCGAQCSSDSDCNDDNPSTVDTCLGDCTCQNIESQYCLQITGMRVLDSAFNEDYTITAGTMYNIEMSTKNNCDNPVSSMQIVQVLKGTMPVNLGTVVSTIQPGDTSVITAGFLMPPGTSPGTAFTAQGFNWNHWIDQNPGTFQILSESSQVGFQSA